MSQRGLGAGSGLSFFGAFGSTWSGGFCDPRFSGGALGCPFASYTSVYVPFFLSSAGAGAVGATCVEELPGLLAGGGVVPLGRGVTEGLALGAVRDGGGSGRVSVPEATGRGVAGDCVGPAGVAVWLGVCGVDAAAPAGGGGGGGEWEWWCGELAGPSRVVTTQPASSAAIPSMASGFNISLST
jgi:hypothetical protein